MSEADCVLFPSTFLTETAAVWWYTIVQMTKVPKKWYEFKTLIQDEFIPKDHMMRARENLLRLRQLTSTPKYLEDFRNITLRISDMAESEMFDKFVDGLKRDVKIEVMKSTVGAFEHAAQVALRVDCALWSASRIDRARMGGPESRPVPMEIGNVQNNKYNTDQRKTDR